VMLTITSPANHARLDDFHRMQRRLADPRTVSGPDELDRLLDEGRTIVMITHAIHSTEVGTGQSAAKLAHHLASSDDERVREILDHGIPVASIQTQYSVIDRRPAGRLAALGRAHGIPLLCYGSVAGGLLSNHYLSRPKPQDPYENRSLTKYLLMIEEMGGWESFQGLLQVLSDIAEQRGTDVATVASSYCLEQDAVRACIVGVRNTDHLDRHVALHDTVTLTGRELDRIESARSTLGEIPGAVYALERDIGGRHGRIMSYDLNSKSA